MKKFLILIITSALLTGAVGCAKGNDENSTNEDAMSPNSVSVKLADEMVNINNAVSDIVEGKETISPNLISAKIADEIENLSGSVYLNEVLYADWQSGKDYGTHTIDTYTSNNDNILLFDINKDGSINEISISNPNASMDALYSLISLVTCIFNVDSLGLTSDDMHVFGYAIAGENGIEEEKHFSLEMRNFKEMRSFKVGYLNEVSEGLETRNLHFYMQFIK